MSKLDAPVRAGETPVLVYLEFRGLRLEYEAGGSGSRTPILFFHATGFPVGSYAPLLRRLEQAGHPTFALNFMGHGASEPTMDFGDWRFFRDQVRALAEHLGARAPFIGIGHSIGGASLLMAAPDLPFKALVLLDPTVLTPFISWLAPFLPHPLAGIAERRRSEFKNRRVVERSYRLSPLFKDWDNESFQGYLDSVLEPHGEGLHLRMSPALEAKIFRSFHRGQWREFKRNKAPALVVRAVTSPVTPPRAASRIVSWNPASKSITHQGSHTFPMEDPAGVAALIVEFLKAQDSQSNS